MLNVCLASRIRLSVEIDATSTPSFNKWELSMNYSAWIYPVSFAPSCAVTEAQQMLGCLPEYKGISQENVCSVINNVFSILVSSVQKKKGDPGSSAHNIDRKCQCLWKKTWRVGLLRCLVIAGATSRQFRFPPGNVGLGCWRSRRFGWCVCGGIVALSVKKRNPAQSSLKPALVSTTQAGWGWGCSFCLLHLGAEFCC